MYAVTLTLLGITILIVFFFLINLKWCVKTIREIASPKNQGGYTKLIQMGMIVLLSSIFIFIAIYYVLNDGKVDKIDLVFTVTVGWLGLIIGKFFSERAMESLENDRLSEVQKSLEINKKEREINEKLIKTIREKLLKKLKEKKTS